MCKNWLLIGWACVKIRYSLPENARKLVTCWLSIRRNQFSAPRAFSEISSVPLVTRSSVLFSCPFLTSSVPCLTFLFLVSRPLYPVSRLSPLSAFLFLLSHVFVPSLPPSVPCLTSLFLVSRPLSPVLRLCSLSSVLCTLSHVFVPCPPSSVPCLTSLFLVSHPLSPVLRLCSSLLICVW